MNLSANGMLSDPLSSPLLKTQNYTKQSTLQPVLEKKKRKKKKELDPQGQKKAVLLKTTSKKRRRKASAYAPGQDSANNASALKAIPLSLTTSKLTLVKP